MNSTSALKWINIPGSTEKKYELWNCENKLLTLTYDPSIQTAKIEAEDSRRLFHIDKKGIFKNKIILRNEYGVEVGQLGFGIFKQNAGFINLNDEHFQFLIQKPFDKLVIYKTAGKIPLLICNIAAAYKNTLTQFIKSNEEIVNNQACLLMSLCRFLFLPASKKNYNALSDIVI